MKTKNIVLGLFVIGILFVGSGFVNGFDDNETPVGDEDKDGINDEYEDDNKRNIEVWIGENVIEVTSIKRHGTQKDVIDLKVGLNEFGISIRVSYGIYINCKPEEPKESEEPKNCEDTIEYKLTFEVFFRGLIEYVDVNDNGVLDNEIDEIVSDYGFYSFQPIEYSLESISEDSSIHYILINTTDGIFALHVFLVEEFVYIDDNLISPTQAKIDIEITNYNYLANNSKLALFTKLWSEENYGERDKTEDEEAGYATDEKEVFVERDVYSGFFSWKETALIDGVEMEVLAKRITLEEEEFQRLYLCYPRGNHIYHDPKIGILIRLPLDDLTPIVVIVSIISIIGAVTIMGVVLRRRRIL
jgi:hypothetical protein